MVAPRVVLVGAPGAGKTTVGGLLAESLGVELHDTDQAVERITGKSVAETFFDEGEAVFRELETAAVAAALVDQGGVVALGGGAVMSEATRLLLRSTEAPVLWLQVSLPDAARRVGLARDRPVLALNPRAQLHALLAERAPLYAEVATLVIDTDGRAAGAVAADALALLS